MSTNNILFAPRNQSRVNLNDSHEVSYWIHTFNIAEAELRKVVQSVGTSVFRVEEELKHLGRKPLHPAA